MNQKQVWNRIAKPWSEYRQKTLEEVINFLKDKKGKVLDLGCGSGRNMIKQEGIEFYGVDFSESMIQLAKQNAQKNGINAKFKLSEANKLDYDSEFFDYALFISTLHCIQGEANRKKALSELYRVLKEGGEAIVSVWNKDIESKLGKLEAKEGFVNWANNGENYARYYYFYDEDELVYLLKEVGFEVIKIDSYGDEKHAKKNIVVYVKKS
jgi:tRNA (uracil-5-)-methyltransferase TRM9